jgi:hypothetical protein
MLLSGMRVINQHAGCQRADGNLCHAESSMRDPQEIERDLIEIGAIFDDSIKIEEIIAWCATHPEEIPVAMRILLGKVEHPKVFP